MSDNEVVFFMQKYNMDAYKSLKSNFKKILKSGIWVSKRNSVVEKLYDPSAN